ncbi:MAG: peptidylprolyl isomerase [Alphaproteobacteria bacterium]|nr:MAG: peptidylprolyl isomerase [Alphaproteobacteria bacterium]
MKKLILTLILGALSMTANAVEIKDPENTLFLDVPAGRVTIQMFPQQAPVHVARIKELVREGYYDGKLWHRVIDGFMAQTGSPRGDGIGGSSKPDLKAEFNQMSHVRGVASMARTSLPDTANAQFFIMLASNPGLDGQYTVWGQVIDGMDKIDAIKKGDSRNNGLVTGPDSIIKMTIAADAK